MKKTTILLLSVFAASPLLAALELLSPTDGKTVALVPDDQKKVMNLPTLEERIALVKSDEKLKASKWWRKSVPLVLKMRTTSGEEGPWKVEIGKEPDLSDARVWYLSRAKNDKATGGEAENAAAQAIAEIEVPRANLEIATRYYWRVSYRGRCGFGCHPGHGCAECKVFASSEIASFVTEDFAPRWIAIEGRVENFRDFGGRRGLCGKRVRQGMIYRGQGLNDNSISGEAQGPNRLTVEDVKYLTGKLGIKTDLDLRGEGEVVDMAESPLGPNVTFINRSSYHYAGIFKPEGMKVMAENFRVFCDRKNYPIYFHCIAGADRTGALAYVMHAVLGVDRHENETDWESTFYPNIPDSNPDPEFWCRESHFNAGFAKYGTAETSWNDRVVLYLKACGITDDEIAAFREIMLVRNDR